MFKFHTKFGCKSAWIMQMSPVGQSGSLQHAEQKPPQQRVLTHWDEFTQAPPGCTEPSIKIKNVRLVTSYVSYFILNKITLLWICFWIKIHWMLLSAVPLKSVVGWGSGVTLPSQKAPGIQKSCLNPSSLVVLHTCKFSHSHPSGPSILYTTWTNLKLSTVQSLFSLFFLLAPIRALLFITIVLQNI